VTILFLTTKGPLELSPKRTHTEEVLDKEYPYQQKFPQPAGISSGRGETQYNKFQ